MESFNKSISRGHLYKEVLLILGDKFEYSSRLKVITKKYDDISIFFNIDITSSPNNLEQVDVYLTFDVLPNSLAKNVASSRINKIKYDMHDIATSVGRKGKTQYLVHKNKDIKSSQFYGDVKKILPRFADSMTDMGDYFKFLLRQRIDKVSSRASIPINRYGKEDLDCVAEVIRLARLLKDKKHEIAALKILQNLADKGVVVVTPSIFGTKTEYSQKEYAKKVIIKLGYE